MFEVALPSHSFRKKSMLGKYCMKLAQPNVGGLLDVSHDDAEARL
jgi:hypothetical protein